MRPLVILCSIAAVCFFAMFCPLTKTYVPFWPMMVGTTFTLGVSALYFGRRDLKEIYSFKFWHVPVGIVAAAALYLAFWIGHFLSTIILPFAESQIDSIYSIRADQNPWLIGALLVCIIGPAEEIFWRGFVQHRLAQRWSSTASLQTPVITFRGSVIASRASVLAFLASAALYTAVHAPSMNLMLIGASALCGGFWGLLFGITSRLWPCIISHALWDVTIFLIFPIV